MISSHKLWKRMGNVISHERNRIFLSLYMCNLKSIIICDSIHSSRIYAGFHSQSRMEKVCCKISQSLSRAIISFSPQKNQCGSVSLKRKFLRWQFCVCERSHVDFRKFFKCFRKRKVSATEKHDFGIRLDCRIFIEWLFISFHIEVHNQRFICCLRKKFS
jgi:hypothetical protein